MLSAIIQYHIGILIFRISISLYQYDIAYSYWIVFRFQIVILIVIVTTILYDNVNA